MTVPSWQDAAIPKIRRAMKKIERRTGDGSEVSGTGYTVARLRVPPIGQLIEKHKIGHPEQMAAQDIERAFTGLTRGMGLRGQTFERVDRSHGDGLSVNLLDAINRYQDWARHWSRRAKRGDRTLEIVIAAVIDQRPFRTIDLDIGMRGGKAMTATIRGLRDYASRAGWCERRTAVKWKSDAAGTFRLLRIFNS